MRVLMVLTMFAVSFADAGWKDFSETRDLQLDANELTQLTINAGAGTLEVVGAPGSDRILATATIEIDNSDDDEAMQFIEESLTLTLTKRGRVAQLDAGFERRFWSDDRNARVNLVVRLPDSLQLDITDSSGSLEVSDMSAAVRIDDSSGSIDVNGADSLEIEDGSGSIEIRQIAGDVRIDDGSGSIKVRTVEGSVYIDDGSGSIRVEDVRQDLVVTESGSGSLTYANVAGVVEGDIED